MPDHYRLKKPCFMTQKNNLAIRIQVKKKPLPAQVKAADVEILWGRIAAAVLGVIMLLVIGVWMWLHSPSSHAPPSKKSSNALTATEVQSSSSAPATVTAEVPEPVPETVASEIAQITAAPEPAVGADALPAGSAQAVANTLEPSPAKPINNAKTSPVRPQASTAKAANVTSNQPLAEVKINSALITSAALSTEISKRMPGAPLPQVVHLNGAPLLTLYFFTHYQNAKGQWLYHDWYRNGKRIARIKSRPHLKAFKAYSSKYIDKFMLGDWQVKVSDQQGKVLAAASFTLAP